MDSFNKEHIRSSVNVPVDEDNFTSRVEQIAGSKEREVVVYCASFDCDASTRAAEKLQQEGFTQVYDYEGGTKDWFAHQYLCHCKRHGQLNTEIALWQPYLYLVTGRRRHPVVILS